MAILHRPGHQIHASAAMRAPLPKANKNAMGRSPGRQ